MAENSPFLRAKVGDFVHFSKFYNTEQLPPDHWERNVWGVVTEVYTPSWIEIDKFTGKDCGLHQADSTDTGRVVRKLPDEIWAQYCAWRLTQ